MSADDDTPSHAKKALSHLGDLSFPGAAPPVADPDTTGAAKNTETSGIELWDMLQYISGDKSSLADELDKAAISLRGIRGRVTGKPPPDRIDAPFTAVPIPDTTLYRAQATKLRDALSVPVRQDRPDIRFTVVDLMSDIRQSLDAILAAEPRALAPPPAAGQPGDVDPFPRRSAWN